MNGADALVMLEVFLSTHDVPELLANSCACLLLEIVQESPVPFCEG
jgi:hypothetical protein